MPTPDMSIADCNLSPKFFQKQMKFVLTFGIMQRKIFWKASFNNKNSFATTWALNRNKEQESQVNEKEKSLHYIALAIFLIIRFQVHCH
jgi:hypothetical protein